MMIDDPVDTLLIDVRASTQGFADDIRAMRGTFDTTLVEGFARAGDVLERGLSSAIRRGGLGFEDLRRVAMAALDDIAARIAQGGGIGAGSGPAPAMGGIGDLLGDVVGTALGLPGRATGGPVAPGRAYLVGEKGPEVFVPTSSGRIETGGEATRPREVRVSIQLAAQPGASAPVALQRSARQVASSVRRALREF